MWNARYAVECIVVRASGRWVHCTILQTASKLFVFSCAFSSLLRSLLALDIIITWLEKINI